LRIPDVGVCAGIEELPHRGEIVEEGGAQEVHDNPQHAYTKALIDASPVPDPDLQRAKREERRLLRVAVGVGA
jgi:ABC-type oligopeptide transport system ATPase subunit